MYTQVINWPYLGKGINLSLERKASLRDPSKMKQPIQIASRSWFPPPSLISDFLEKTGGGFPLLAATDISFCQAL